jgi:opacity protein-like surface antigen
MNSQRGRKLKTRPKHLRLILLASSLLALCAHAWTSQTQEWTLKVSAAKAQVRQRPDAASPVVSVLPKGMTLKSFAKEGEWFRVIIEPEPKGLVVVGYISSAEVEVVEKKAAEEPKLWEEVTPEFRGVGLSVRLGGGFFFFGSGDIKPGVAGMFDQTEDIISSLDAVIEESKKVSLQSGYDIWGDVIYHLNSRIGAGLRFDYFKASSENTLRFTMDNPYEPYTIWTLPDIIAFSISPEFYYSYPLSRLLTFVANGGPTVYFVEYRYGQKFIIPAIEEDVEQKVKATRFGFQGGIGLEFRLNPRATVFVETQGRYARISSLEGEEILFRSWYLQIFSSKENGTLYYEEAGKYPSLVVLTDESAAARDVRKAVLDLSGISLALGIRFKF